MLSYYHINIVKYSFSFIYFEKCFGARSDERSGAAGELAGSVLVAKRSRDAGDRPFAKRRRGAYDLSGASGVAAHGRSPSVGCDARSTSPGRGTAAHRTCHRGRSRCLLQLSAISLPRHRVATDVARGMSGGTQTPAAASARTAAIPPGTACPRRSCRQGSSAQEARLCRRACPRRRDSWRGAVWPWDSGRTLPQPPRASPR